MSAKPLTLSEAAVEALAAIRAADPRRLEALLSELDGEGGTPLHIAAQEGQLDCVRVLLPISDPHARTESGKTPLMLASEHHHPACVELLLPVSDVNAKEYSQGHTALTLAADSLGLDRPESARVECIELLLTRASQMPQAFVNDALRRVAQTSNAGAVRALAAHANLSSTDREGKTPLAIAAEHGRANCVKALLDAGADPRARLRGWKGTALILAARSGNVECVQALLPVSDPSALDSVGRTALNVAEMFERPECVSALLPSATAQMVRRVVEKQIELCRGLDYALPALDRFLAQLSEHGVAAAEELHGVAFEALGAKRLPRAAAVSEQRELARAVKDAARAAETPASREAASNTPAIPEPELRAAAPVGRAPARSARRI